MPRAGLLGITPGDTGYIHRFFNSSPISPLERFLALTKFPYEDRVPEPGDVAEVVLVDLTTGETRTVAETAGWDTRTGAHVQWGGDDSEPFFNSVSRCRPAPATAHPSQPSIPADCPRCPAGGPRARVGERTRSQRR